MRARRAWLAVGAVVFFVSGAIGACTAGAAGWLAPVVVAPAPVSGTAGTPGVLIDSRGNEVLSWQDLSPNGETCTAAYVASRVQGGDFATSNVGCGTNVWLSPTGVVYIDGPDGSGGLGEAHAPAGQLLPTSFTHVGSPAGAAGDALLIEGDRVLFDAAGDPTFFYFTTDRSVGPPNPRVLSAAALNPDGSWTAQQVTQSDGTADPSAFVYTVAPNGSALALWTYAGALDYSRRSAGTWSPPAAMPTDSYGFPQLVSDPQSRFTVLYETGTYPNGGVGARTMDTSGTWSGAQALPMATDYSDASNGYQLAFDSAGNAVAAVWEMAMDVNAHPCEIEPTTTVSVPCGILRVYSRAAGQATWTDEGDDLVGPTGDEFKALELAFDPHDNAALELDAITNTFTQAVSRFYFARPAGATAFAATAAPSTPPGSSSPTLSVDPDGYAVATWVDASGNVLSSVYDAVAPTVDTFNVPANPVAGQPASFDVGGSDLWGPVTYSIDFGDGQTAQGRVSGFPRGRALPGFGLGARARSTSATVTHTYAQPGNYNAAITVTDGAANTATTSRNVAVQAAPATTNSSSLAQTPVPPVTGLPDPVLGRTANVLPVKPVVLVEVPGAKGFVPLRTALQIPMGSLIDTRHGRVRVTVADGRGGFSTADFYEGLFRLVQKPTGTKFASALLSGGRFAGCPGAPRAQLSRKRASRSRSVRHLWASGTGSFRTAGRFASATIRGTTWKTDDRCDGTLTLVTKGKVAVRDFVKNKTVVVTAGHRYLALAKKGRSGRQ